MCVFAGLYVVVGLIPIIFCLFLVLVCVVIIDSCCELSGLCGQVGPDSCRAIRVCTCIHIARYPL